MTEITLVTCKNYTELYLPRYMKTKMPQDYSFVKGMVFRNLNFYVIAFCKEIRINVIQILHVLLQEI